MTTVKKAFLSAVAESFLRGKSLMQAVLAYWLSPLTDQPTSPPPRRPSSKSLDEFLDEAESHLIGPVGHDDLVQLSVGLKKQFFHRLLADPHCMLPSYSHRLPTGAECGRYLALDVGGSTLRVALVELRGEAADQDSRSEIVSMRNFLIGKAIKALQGMAFFAWVADRIQDTLSSGLGRQPEVDDAPLPLALAWSFPIEQTSLGSGKLQPMGKAFQADKGLLGRDLGEIVRDSCLGKGLNVQLRAIVNDSSACLLSRAYSYTSTRFGLILGTGVNMAAYLPVAAIGRSKFGTRPPHWFDEASHVIVNTELGMFGHDILPMTRWDHLLARDHPRPDFQPLEHLVSGLYLGEIVRLALVDAVESTGLLAGFLPPSLTARYSLGTDTLALIQSDTTSDLAEAIKIFSDRHPSRHPPSTADMQAMKTLASLVSLRSSALVAACVFAMWDARLEAERAYMGTLPITSPERRRAELDIQLEKTTVAFNGGVIEKYPDYLGNCQRTIDQLMASQGLAETRSIDLVPAKESSLLGAAVALACIDRDV